jgi:hypothetical protein
MEFRNPDEDLPRDFEVRRTEHYQALRKPIDPAMFIDALQSITGRWGTVPLIDVLMEAVLRSDCGITIRSMFGRADATSGHLLERLLPPWCGYARPRRCSAKPWPSTPHHGRRGGRRRSRTARLTCQGSGRRVIGARIMP